MLQKFHGVVLALTKFPKITIAEVQGACLGGGAELAMVCDMAFTPDAEWGFPEIKLGCYPRWRARRWRRWWGRSAQRNRFLPDGHSGEEAAGWGLANEAHPESELQRAIAHGR